MPFRTKSEWEENKEFEAINPTGKDWQIAKCFCVQDKTLNESDLQNMEAIAKG